VTPRLPGDSEDSDESVSSLDSISGSGSDGGESPTVALYSPPNGHDPATVPPASIPFPSALPAQAVQDACPSDAGAQSSVGDSPPVPRRIYEPRRAADAALLRALDVTSPHTVEVAWPHAIDVASPAFQRFDRSNPGRSAGGAPRRGPMSADVLRRPQQHPQRRASTQSHSAQQRQGAANGRRDHHNGHKLASGSAASSSESPPFKEEAKRRHSTAAIRSDMHSERCAL
jgi:hypothetical protein